MEIPKSLLDKSALKRFAIQSRQELVEKVRNKISSYYIYEKFCSEQKGEIYILYNEKHSLSLTIEEFKKRELLIKRVQELSLEQVVEEAAYTWFNRIIAIRYMEINNILPLARNNDEIGIRVLSSKENTIEPEILKFRNLVNKDLDINFEEEEYVKLNSENEKYKYILLLVCKKLSMVIPQVFGGITDYIDILIPDNLLNETGFISKLIKEVAEEEFLQVEIIGWLYQYYIIEKKEKVFDNLKNNVKISKEDIPVATQFFTPEWIVKFMVENSLGKYLKEKYNISSELDYCCFVNSVNYDEEIENIKCCDPCCGSGYILTYIFKLLYEGYLKKGYSKNIIAKKILENNIVGLDIDERAIQLTSLTLLLIARQYDKGIFKEQVDMKVFSIKESNSISASTIEYLKNIVDGQDEIIDYLLEIFKDATEYGSIIKVKDYDYIQILTKIESINKQLKHIKEIGNKFIPLIKQAIYLSKKYDFVITNPPYRGLREVDIKLAEYLKTNYPNSKYDLYTVLLECEVNMLKNNGVGAIITPNTWLTIGSYTGFRQQLLNNIKISTFMNMGSGIFGADVGSIVKFASFSFIKNNREDVYYVDFIDYKANKFDINKKKFDIKSIPEFKIDFSLTKEEIECFNKGRKLEDIVTIAQGMATSNNKRFLREWYEVDYRKINFTSKSEKEAKESKFRWFPYNKGGEYRKWYGNIGTIINYFNDGEEVKDYARSLYKSASRTIKNTKLFFRNCVTYTLISAKISARYSNNGFIFDVAGPSIFAEESELKMVLAFISSNVAIKLLGAINNSYNKQVGDLKLLPYIENSKDKEEIVMLVDENIEISKQDLDSFEMSWNFKVHPLVNTNKETIKEAFQQWAECCKIRFNKLKKNEEDLNYKFIQIYDLKNSVSKEVLDKDVTIRIADRKREVKSLISYAVGCMFGRYSIDEVGLVYAGGEFDINRYKLYKPSNDNIIPITDKYYFAGDIVERFNEFIKLVYGEKTLNENLEFIAETLGKKGVETAEETIRRYFNTEFYLDHIKMYKKRPIYWLFDSGKKNGFKALIYIHRYNEDSLARIRVDYVQKVQKIYEKVLVNMENKFKTNLSMNEKKEIQKYKTDVSCKLQEIREYDEKIAHLANKKISIDLDDGVIVNYAKFKDVLAKMK